MNKENVYTIERSETEEIRLALSEYKGKKYIDIRIFFQSPDTTEMKPTKKGITISQFHASKVIEGLKYLINEEDEGKIT